MYKESASPTSTGWSLLFILFTNTGIFNKQKVYERFEMFILYLAINKMHGAIRKQRDLEREGSVCLK